MLDFRAICAAYGVGEPTSSAVRLEGGVHRCWRITTTRGVYVVKEPLPGILARPAGRDQYEKPEEIGRGYGARGIPVATAHTINGKAVNEVSGQLVMLFDFIEGHPAHSPANPEFARIMGRTLGQMHQDPPQV